MSLITMRILLIAHAPRLRAQLERLLLRHGYGVKVVTSGASALEKLEAGGVDLVILDADLRDVGSGELLKQVRRRFALLELPVLATGAQHGERVVELLRYGANDYISAQRPGRQILDRVEALLTFSQQAPSQASTGAGTPGALARWYCRVCRFALRSPRRPCPSCQAEPPAEGWPPVAGSPWPDLGTVVAGRYRLDRQLGQGHTGVVYKALDVEFHGVYAVKVVDVGGLTGRVGDEDVRRRIEREVQALVWIRNPHVVKIFDFANLRPGVFALIMDYIAGHSLADRLEGDRLPLRTCLDVVTQVARGLHDAHGWGLVHRDVKPDNIMLKPLTNGETFATLLDFGLVEIFDHPRPASGFYGTLLYTSPEQLVEGRAVDHRADVYGLGAVLFHALTGRPPYGGHHPAAVLSQHLKAPVPSILGHIEGSADLAGLDAIVRRMLAKRPEDRYPTLGEVITALNAQLAALG